MERVSYNGISDCARLSNREIELIVADSRGLEIILFGFLKGENLLCASRRGEPPGSSLGHAMTTFPAPGVVGEHRNPARVVVQEREGGWCFVQDESARWGVVLELEIALDALHPGARLSHRLKNVGEWPITLGIICSSACESGGIAIAPLPGRYMGVEPHVPCGALVLWPSTDLSDPRIGFGRDTITLTHRQAMKTAWQIGFTNTDNWLGYWRNKVLFVINSTHRAQREYPRGGASSELGCSAECLRINTHSPITVLQPGESLEHVEQWRLFRDVPEPVREEIIIQEIFPRITKH